MNLRIEQIFEEETKGDNSFKEKTDVLSFLFGETKYTQQDMRKTWHLGIKHGIEIGLKRASIEGQRIELINNTSDIKHLEFIRKFYELAKEYECAIQYHPKHGMITVSRKP